VRHPPHQIHQHWYRSRRSSPRLTLILPLSRILPNPLSRVSLRGIPPSSQPQTPSLGLDDDLPTPFRLLWRSRSYPCPGTKDPASLLSPPFAHPRSIVSEQDATAGSAHARRSHLQLQVQVWNISPRRASETLLPHTRTLSPQLGAARHSFILGYHLTLHNTGKAGRSALIKGGTAGVGAVSVSACSDVSECLTIPIAYLFPSRLPLDTVRSAVTCAAIGLVVLSGYTAILILPSKRSDVL
jgi:hypothetical protein